MLIEVRQEDIVNTDGILLPITGEMEKIDEIINQYFSLDIVSTWLCPKGCEYLKEADWPQLRQLTLSKYFIMQATTALEMMDLIIYVRPIGPYSNN